MTAVRFHAWSLVLAAVAAAPWSVRAQSEPIEANKPFVVLLGAQQEGPGGAVVAALVRRRVAALSLLVVVDTPDRYPFNQAQWTALMRRWHAQRPGLVAVFGWNCTAGRCFVYAGEPVSGSVASIPVQAGDGTSDSQAIARAIDVALVGGLLPDLHGVARGEAVRPTAPNTPTATESATPPPKRLVPRRWLAGGYVGAFDVPSPEPTQGAWVGAFALLVPHVETGVRLGWRGLVRWRSSAARVRVGLFHAAVPLQLRFLLGDGQLRLGAVVRAEWRHVAVVPLQEATRRSSRFALFVGGEIGWRIPLWRSGWFVAPAAGVAVAAVAPEVRVDDVVVARPPVVALHWLLGILRGW